MLSLILQLRSSVHTLPIITGHTLSIWMQVHCAYDDIIQTMFEKLSADEQLLKQVPEKFIIPSRHLQTLKETIGQGIFIIIR